MFEKKKKMIDFVEERRQVDTGMLMSKKENKDGFGKRKKKMEGCGRAIRKD
jgi:hypothetical protein